MPLDPNSANTPASTASDREFARTTTQYPHGLSSLHRRDQPAPRLIPMAALSPIEPRSPLPPPEGHTFHAFLTLPPELRLVIYSHYFTFPDHLIGPKSHPRTRHATALLYVSHQVHEEALPVLYAEATLTVNLHPRYHKGVRDYAWWLDHYVRPGGNFRGHVCAMGKFAHVRVVLDELAPLPSPPQGQRQGVPGAEGDDTATAAIDASNWWQHIAPLFWSTLAYCTLIHIPDLTVELRLGDIFTAPPYPVIPRTTGALPATAPTAMPGPAANPPPTATSFATYATHPYFGVHGWNSSNAQRPSNTLKRTTGANFLRRGWRGFREAVCLMQVVFWMGRMAEGSEGVVVQAVGEKRKITGEGLIVKIGDEERKVEGDKLPALVKVVEEMMQEKGADGEGEGENENGERDGKRERDAWLVVKMKRKTDAEKGAKKNGGCRLSASNQVERQRA